MPTTFVGKDHPSDGPAADTIEVSIFGPGRGESVLVHLGAGDWIVVDSCKNQLTRTNPVLDYLDRIGVDVATQVKLVVGTHAHDDHINGLSEIFERSESAAFVTSAATLGKEFFAAVQADVSIEAQVTSRVREEYRRIIAEAKRKGRATPGDWIYSAQLNQLLWKRSASTNVQRVVVTAISPSNNAIFRSKEILATALSSFANHSILSNGDPNEMAVALWVEAGHQRMILGADLLKGPAGCGWRAVLTNFDSDGEKASLIKIPHHGSENAHHGDVWGTLLSDQPTALLTPYRNGDKSVPKKADMHRILSLTDEAYITATPHKPTPKSAKNLMAAMAGLAVAVREPHGVPGHVRARSSGGQPDWDIEMFTPARHVSQAI